MEEKLGELIQAERVVVMRQYSFPERGLRLPLLLLLVRDYELKLL